jgi:ABC-type dipeptide/oligopeptide/nickel transport system permease component
MSGLDVAALLILAIVAVVGIAALVVLAILPGSIAERRQHPQTDAIRVTGYLGILFPPLWLVAFIWAYTRPDTFEVASAARVNERIAMLEQRVGVADKIETERK